MTEEERLINLDIDLDSPIEIGVDTRSLGIPNWDITFIMLSDYIRTRDIQIKEQLQEVLKDYEEIELSYSNYEATIQVMIDTPIIETVIEGEQPPSYEEAIKTINKKALEQYLVLTDTDKVADDPQTFKHFIALTIEPIAFNLYNIYNIDQYNKYIEQVEDVQNKRLDYINSYKEAESTDERLKLQREFTKWETEKSRDKFMFDYREKTYKSYDTKEAIEYISQEVISSNREEEKELLPQLIKPTDHIVTIDKISNQFWAGAIGTNTSNTLGLERRGTDDKVDVIVRTIVENEQDKIPDNVNSEDMRVFAAYHTLLKAGNKAVTLNDFYRTMTANPNVRLRSARQENAIISSLRKMAPIYLEIDTRAEMEAYTKYKDLKPFYEGNMISFSMKVTYRGGYPQPTILLGSPSPLFWYASDKNQIARARQEVWNLPLRYDRKNQDLKDYFMRRFLESQNKHNDRNKSISQSDRTITYDSIYRNLHFNYQTNNKETLRIWQHRTEKSIEKILDHLLMEKEIKEYWTPKYKAKLKNKQISKEKHNDSTIKDKVVFIF